MKTTTQICAVSTVDGGLSGGDSITCRDSGMESPVKISGRTFFYKP